MPLWPDDNERSYVEFLIGKGHFGLRYLLAGGLFVLGLWLCLAGVCLPVGLVVILLGHLPLWVKRQKLAPAPVDPLGDEVWAPADPDWYQHVQDLVRKGRRWDQSLWDLSSPLVIVTLMVLGALGFVLFSGLVALSGPVVAFPFMIGLAAVWAPLFLNGMRAPWHPDQLRIKGKALLPVADQVERSAPEAYDVVPLLGLREGKRGRYPVDARVMLRPKADDGSGFIGVQVQACINNVRGTNYPYVYCVVLGKTGFRIRASHGSLVLEPGAGDDVDYLVVRQHADRRSGWHTDPAAVAQIVHVALEIAERARRANA